MSMQQPPPPPPRPPPAVVSHTPSIGRSSRFLSRALKQLEVGAPNVSPSGATARSPVGFGKAIGKRKIHTDIVPPVHLEPFQLEEDSRRFRDLDSSEERARLLKELDGQSRMEEQEEEDAAALYNGFLLSDEDAADARKADEAMAAHLAERNRTFLTSLDMDTQLALMRAHYATYAHGAPKLAAETGGSQTARNSRANTSHANARPGTTTDQPSSSGSLTARPSTRELDTQASTKRLKASKTSHVSLSHLSSSASLLNGGASSASLLTTGFTATGTGGQRALVFNAAAPRFPSEEKHELGLYNAVSLYTALPKDLDPSGINSAHKMFMKYRLPRSSELEKSIFVKALPGTVGIPMMSPHEASGYVSCLPRRNQFLLNPSTLDPITPGPGSYLGLTRTEYEKGKVKELGGVMKTVTATNGILRERYRREPTETIIPEGSHVADTASLTKSGRQNTSAAYQAAVLGTGSLTHLARRRLRKPGFPGEAPKHESVTTFSTAERQVGLWHIQRARTFLGPGYHAPSIEEEGWMSSFNKFGSGGSLTEKLIEAAESRKAIDPSGSGSGGPDGDGGGGGGHWTELTSAEISSLVASKLNYNPLPSALTEVPRNALVGVSKDVLKNPGPGAFHVQRAFEKSVLAHTPSVRIVKHLDTVDLDALRKRTTHQPESSGGSGAIVASVKPKRHKPGGSKEQADPHIDLGYFPSSSQRSLGLAITRTPGPGAYSPALGQTIPHASSVKVESSFQWNHLPNLAGFNSSAKRGVGVEQRGLNQNEIAVLAGGKAHGTSVGSSKREESKTVSVGGIASPFAPSSPNASKQSTIIAGGPSSPSASAAGPTSPRPPSPTSFAPAQLDPAVLAQLELAQALRAKQLQALLIGDGQVDSRDLLDLHGRMLRKEIAASERQTIEEEEKKQWLVKQHREEVRDKALQTEEARQAKIALIEKRATHIEQRSLWLLTQQRWMQLLVHSRFIFILWQVNSTRQSILREISAAIKIQDTWIQFKVRRDVKERFRRLKERLRSNMLQFVIAHRIRKKRAAGILLSRFFRDHFLRKGEKMFRLVQNFKKSITTIQRFWRKHYAKHCASLELNLRVWNARLNEVDVITIHHRKREAAIHAAIQQQNESFLVPVNLSSPASKRSKKVSESLVNRYNLNSNLPGRVGVASVNSNVNTKIQSQSHMNALKELILEKLHERRVRIESEKKKQQIMQAALQQASVATGSGRTSSLGIRPSPPRSGRSSVIGSLDAHYHSNMDHHQLHSTAHANGNMNGGSDGGEESYEVERARYKALFQPLHLSNHTGRKLKHSPSSTPTSPNLRTPLSDHLRKLSIAAAEAKLKALASNTAAGTKDPDPLSNPASPSMNAIPHSHPPPRKSSPEPPPSQPKKRLRTPKGRKPLYTPRPQPNIVLPQSRLPAPLIPLPGEQAAMRKEKEMEERERRMDEGEEENDVAKGTNDTTAAAASSAEVASPPPQIHAWTGLVVSLPIRQALLRQILREARHSHWRSLSLYRRTLDEFLTHKLSSNESSLERARLFLTGSSNKLLLDRTEYIRTHPIPRMKPILDRSLMKLLIIQGYLDQAEILDELATRRAQVLSLIQSNPTPHAVPDLFHIAGSSEQGGAGGEKKSTVSGSSNNAAATSKSPPGKSKGFSSSISSTLNPSPVRLLRMQAQAQADARNMMLSAQRAAAGDQSGGASPTSLEIFPPPHATSLPHSNLLQTLRSGVVTIPGPSIPNSVLERHSSTMTSPQRFAATVNSHTPTTDTKAAALRTPTVATSGTSETAAAAATTTTPSPRALLLRKSSYDPSLASTQELNALFRSHASHSTHDPQTPSTAADVETRSPGSRSKRFSSERPQHLRQPTMEAAALFQHQQRSSPMAVNRAVALGRQASTNSPQSALTASSPTTDENRLDENKFDLAQATKYKIQVTM